MMKTDKVRWPDRGQAADTTMIKLPEVAIVCCNQKIDPSGEGGSKYRLVLFDQGYMGWDDGGQSVSCRVCPS